MLFQVNRNPNAVVLRTFGRAMLIGFGVIGALLWTVPCLRGGVPVFSWSLSTARVAAVGCAAAGLLLWTLSRPSVSIAGPLYVAWMSGTVAMGVVMSTLMLSALFVTLLPIFSLVVRTGDPLRRKRQVGGSYWENYKGHDATLERMRRSF